MDTRELTAERLREVLNYNPETGVFTWRTTTNRKIRIGDIAGTDSHGYVAIRIDGRRYLAHRLAWLWMNGEWPASIIDHEDTNPSNNRWENLRLATHRINMQNRRRATFNSSTGLLGVAKNRSSFQAQIGANGETHYLGCYATAEEAHAVYVAAKRRLHEGCTL